MNLLERKRLDLGMSVEALATAIRKDTGEAISGKAIRDFERGDREPQAARLKVLADFLGVAPSDLLMDVRAHQNRQNGEAA